MGIEIVDVKKSFDGEGVLSGITLKIQRGEVLAILGVSGTGKTTLLRIIAGLEIPDSGKVFIDGKIATEDSRIIIPPERRKIGFIFQNLALWEHMTVEAHINFVLQVRKSPGSNEETRRILEFFDLYTHRHKKPYQLSGGQKQRLAIARALAQDPEFLLLDEPLSNLDVPRKKQLRRELLRIKEEKRLAIVYVTHDPVDVRLISDRIAVLHDGKIVQTGNYEILVKTPAHPVVSELLGV